MTQSQSSVTKYSYFIFLPPEVSDIKTRGGVRSPNVRLYVSKTSSLEVGQTLLGILYEHSLLPL